RRLRRRRRRPLEPSTPAQRRPVRGRRPHAAGPLGELEEEVAQAVADETLTVVVDAENVRRSIWPNVSRERLVELVDRWAESRDCDVLIVFEGEDESADDRIVRRTAALDRYWLVTSDRELRKRAGGAAERVIGGGSFVRELLDA